MAIRIEVTEDMIQYIRVACLSIGYDDARSAAYAMAEYLESRIDRDYEVGPKLCGVTRTSDPDFTYEKCELPREHSGQHRRWPCTEGCEQW